MTENESGGAAFKLDIPRSSGEEYIVSPPDPDDKTTIEITRLDDGKVINRYSSRVEGDRLVVACTGELDLYSNPALKAMLVHQIAANPQVVRGEYDFTGVTFIDTTTLATLMGAYKRLNRLNPADGPTEHKIIAAERKVAKIFEITGLDQTFFKIELIEDQPDDPR